MTVRNEREIERALKALANRRRMAIIQYLKGEKWKKEAIVGEVAEHIKLSFRSTSKHLAILAGAGILEKEQRSSQVFYHLAPEFPPYLQRLLSVL